MTTLDRRIAASSLALAEFMHGSDDAAMAAWQVAVAHLADPWDSYTMIGGILDHP